MNLIAFHQVENNVTRYIVFKSSQKHNSGWLWRKIISLPAAPFSYGLLPCSREPGLRMELSFHRVRLAISSQFVYSALTRLKEDVQCYAKYRFVMNLNIYPEIEYINLLGYSAFHSGWFIFAYSTEAVVAALPNASSASIFILVLWL